MTPERYDEIRRDYGSEIYNYAHADMPPPRATRAVGELLREVDCLRAELAEARLTAEEAWDAHDEKEIA